jgi:hypothetical protein
MCSYALEVGRFTLTYLMVEPSTDAKIGARGTTYLVPGQTIDIAIIRDNLGEDVFPNNPASKVNGEMIATTRDGYKPLAHLAL